MKHVLSILFFFLLAGSGAMGQTTGAVLSKPTELKYISYLTVASEKEVDSLRQRIETLELQNGALHWGFGKTPAWSFTVCKEEDVSEGAMKLLTELINS